MHKITETHKHKESFMTITSLETMETVVASNRILEWDGWDVLEISKSPRAWSDKNGAYIDGAWYTVKRYAVSSNGWEIPNKFVR